MNISSQGCGALVSFLTTDCNIIAVWAWVSCNAHKIERSIPHWWPTIWVQGLFEISICVGSVLYLQCWCIASLMLSAWRAHSSYELECWNKNSMTNVISHYYYHLLQQCVTHGYHGDILTSYSISIKWYPRTTSSIAFITGYLDNDTQ